MRRLTFLLLWPFLLFLSQPIHSQSILANVQQQNESRITVSHADVAIAFRTLDGKSELYFHADEPFYAASTMKVPVLIELFHQAKEGKLQLTDELTIHNEFHSIVDGSPDILDAADDSESDLKAEGQPVRSPNFAT